MHNDMDAKIYFEKFPEFKESKVASDENRLYERYNKLIQNNRELLEGARVLDLGSHDGRWSMAALKAGAKTVKGLEGRPEMAKQAHSTFTKYNVPEDRFSFDVGDFHALLGRFKKDEFDVVLCLGVLYHTPHNVLLFQQIRDLAPKAVILDTRVCLRVKPLFELGSETWRNLGHGIKEQAQADHVLFCVPSHPAIEMMTAHIGYQLEVIDWHDGSVTDWKALQQYKNLTRRSYILRRMDLA